MYQQRSRHTEKGAIPFRSGRFYSVDNEWWFAIRRGVDHGPYTTKATAKQGLIEYLNEQFTFAKNMKADRMLLSI